MSISEAQRFDMQIGLRQQLGDDVANSLMEHLPPSGWSDVARTRDIEFIDKRLEIIEKRLNVVITVGIAWGTCADCTASANHAQHFAPLRHLSLA